MIDLAPCPFCGEKLVQHDDHHGTWWAHKNEVGYCWASVEQIHDDEDARRWNVRHTPMLADIAQIIDVGWKAGKSAAEVAGEILREFDGPAVTSTDRGMERPSTSAMHDLICAIIEDDAKYDATTNTWDTSKAATAIIAAFDGEPTHE
ncbi:MAG TPA: hypothetical protein VFR76_02015 [Verrucomicrobiae bacterium]|nr:hypothetical protein [Verrucomicrobiae bacterium]